MVSANPSQISEEPKEYSKFYNFTEENLYNELLSSTYKEEECKDNQHYLYGYDEICYAKEKLKFNGKNTIIEKEFPIKLVKNKNEIVAGYIGLLYNNSFFQETKSFITLLRSSENLINNYFYFINIEEKNLLENKIKAQLYIGALPHEIFPEKYSIDNFQYTDTYIASYIPDNWRMTINKIYLNDYIKYTDAGALISLSYEIYHIIGSGEFHRIIKENFMNKLISEKNCFYSNFSQNILSTSNISFYYCKISTKNILYENLNSIKFYSMQFNYSFELRKEELFFIKDDYIYLNILFSDIENNYWTMVQIFTTKYNFVFNTNQKQIGFYKINDLKVNKANDNESNINNNIVIICFIICIIIFVCLGIFIGRKIINYYLFNN